MATGIDKYLNSIKDKILGNQNLCKLLYIDKRNPLAESDLVDTSVIYTDRNNQKLFFTPYAEDVDSNMKSTLNVVVTEFKLDPKSKYFKDVKIEFIVMIHHDLWILDDGTGEICLRPNAIWNELNRTFYDHRSGIGKDEFDHSGLIRSRNGYYSGYRYCMETKDLPLLGGIN